VLGSDRAITQGSRETFRSTLDRVERRGKGQSDIPFGGRIPWSSDVGQNAVGIDPFGLQGLPGWPIPGKLAQGKEE
jgi:hypothetical protein